jgi:excisionase family DNA binding protein
MTAPIEPLVLTVDEAAVLLRVSRGLAFAAVRTGTIPHLRIGRRILIPRNALYELIGAGPGPTAVTGPQSGS